MSIKSHLTGAFVVASALVLAAHAQHFPDSERLQKLIRVKATCKVTHA